MAIVVEFLLAGFTDNSGNPLAGGQVETFEAGTTTPKATFTDQLGATPEANPIILDSNGRKQVYADGSYKFVVKTSAGVTLYTFDNINFGAGATTTFLGTTTGAANLYVASPTPSIASLSDGALFSFQAHQINTGAATLNISGLGAKSITAVPGQIVTGFTYLVRYKLSTDSFSIINVDPGYATTPAEISALNTAGVPIVIRQTVTMTGNLTLSAPLIIEKGGSIVATGYVLTINGPFQAGPYQVFTATTGEVVFGSTSLEYVYSEWFGAVGDNSTNCTAAIQAAIGSVAGAGGTVQFIAGNYRHTGITLPSKVGLTGINAKASDLRFSPTSGDAITLTDGVGNTNYNRITKLGIRCVTTSSGKGIASPTGYYVADFFIDEFEIEGFLVGIYIPYGLQIEIGFGRLIGQGTATANGVGIQLGDRTLGTPRLVNTARVSQAYVSTYYTSFISDGSIHKFSQVTSEAATRAFLIASRCIIEGSWVQATTTLYETRTSGWPILSLQNYHLDGASSEQDDITSMCTLNGAPEDLGVYSKSDFKGPGQFRYRFAIALANAIRLGTVATDACLYESSGAVRIESTNPPLESNRVIASGSTRLSMKISRSGTILGGIGFNASDEPVLLGSGGSNIALAWDNSKNCVAGEGTISTSATNGFLYIPSCAGTPTGVPTAKTGFCPMVVDTTNNRLYFYSSGSWRNAGP